MTFEKKLLNIKNVEADVRGYKELLKEKKVSISPNLDLFLTKTND